MGNLQSLEHGQGGLSKAEIDRLERRMRKLGPGGAAELARSDLLSVKGLAGNPFTDRIFEMFDKDEDRLLLLGDMKLLLEALSRLSDEEARFRFAFAVFDANGDGVIDRSELLQVLQMTNKRNITRSQLEQVVDATVGRWDERGVGALDYPAFKNLLLASTASLSL